MKHINKLLVKIMAAVVIGFLLAGAGTKITYPCTPIDGAASCVSFDKAVMHPSDLFSNQQDSLIHFSTTFVVTALITFTLLSILSASQKSKPRPASRPLS